MARQPTHRFPLSKEGKLPITKVDAAVRQLETAITLWFHDGDPVSICTLSHAAYEILYQLSKTTRKRSTLYDAENVKPEFRDDFKRLIKEAPDFFKHAGKDPHETHFLTVKNAPHIFLDAVSMYNSLEFGARPIFRVFQEWLWFTQPGFFIKPAQEVFGNGADIEGIVAAGKAAYFSSMVPLYITKFAGVKAASFGHR
jgi:hypothetical protein